MNKPATALASTAVVLGAGAVYLLYQIDVERARARFTQPAPQDSAGHAVAQESAPQVASSAGVASARPRPEPADARAVRAALPNNEDHETRQRRQAADYLRRYEDQAERAVLREQGLAAARRSTAGVDERLNLSPEQYEKLVRLIAEQDMDRQVAAARCVVDPACVSPVLDPAVFSARDQDIRDIVGDEGLRELRAYRNAELERRIVNGLQSRLEAGAALTASQASDLTRVLYDETRRQRREIYQSQQHGRGFSLADGPSLTYADDAPTPELALQSGEASVQGIRDRAATLLTGDQLAAFNRMYDDLLIAFRGHIRRQYSQRVPGADRTP